MEKAATPTVLIKIGLKPYQSRAAARSSGCPRKDRRSVDVSCSMGAHRLLVLGISPDPKVARRQGRIEPITKPILGGCHLTRDIPALITRAGFVIENMNSYQHPKEPKIFGWTFEGRAVLA